MTPFPMSSWTGNREVLACCPNEMPQEETFDLAKKSGLCGVNSLVLLNILVKYIRT
jgi:hypothetical protein